MNTLNHGLRIGLGLLACLTAAACSPSEGTGTGTTDTDSGETTDDGGSNVTTNPGTNQTTTPPPTTTDSGGSESDSLGMTTTGVTTTAGLTTTDGLTTTAGMTSTGGALCGDGVVDGGEVCDDGVNDGSYDGCAADCSAFGPTCGDGAVDGPEGCDDGNQIDDDECSISCVAAACGDGVVQAGAGEACDDGNLDDTDQCVGECAVASCGDSFILTDVEACDDGVNDGAYGGCAMDCATLGPSCGDGILNGPEVCDDANVNSQDGCLANCVKPQSCLEIKTFDDAAKDGVYSLTVGNQTWSAYCDMTFDGGGWTLAAKANPGDGWGYDNARWTNNLLFQANMPDFDHVQAKLATWNLVPFMDVLLGMESPVVMMNPPKPVYVKLGLAGASLFALFSPNMYVATTVTKPGWQGLVPGSSLQANCNKEGINNAPGGMNSGKVRLGILSNTQNDCNSPESAIGLGLGGFTCQVNPFVSVGNLNCEANPAIKKPGMAWVFVR